MSSERITQPVHLRRGEENGAEIELLAGRFGGTVGLAAVLGDLNRTARTCRVRGGRVSGGFTWDDADQRSERWWPQGITSSADASADGDAVLGRRLLVTSWYSTERHGENHGSRVTFIDLDTLEYRHVLLVTPQESFGEVVLKALTVHAGGLVWFGPYLHVAGTRRGLLTCRLDDVIEVAPGRESFGHRYVLPVRFGYDAFAATGTEKLRYSFLSLDRSVAPPELVAGEYGVGEHTRRLARYPIDPHSNHLDATEDGTSYPVLLHEGGVEHMQGIAVVDGTYYATGSRGRLRLGHLHVGRPGEFRTIPRALPVGPEDITYWPETDLLWSLTEYPGKRCVFSVPRAGLSQ